MAWVYGTARFDPDEEYEEFQYRLLLWLMLSASVVTWVVILKSWDSPGYSRSLGPWVMGTFALLALLGWWGLRGRKQLFTPIAWVFMALVLVENLGMWFWVPGDELRALWLVVNVPAAYVVLGQRLGAVVTGLCIGLLALGHWLDAQAYSVSALVTFGLVLVYLAAFFHLYVDRSLSYYERMRASNQRLRELATHDHLTGVLNARAFAAQAERLMLMSARRSAPCAMLFADLDHFKRINDRHGHAAGDAVLHGVAQALVAQLRQSDVLGRVGGEEFAVFLPDTDLAGAARVAEGLRHRIEALALDVGGGKSLYVTASIGVASQHGDAQPLGVLQQHADEAMYQAKAQGRNRVAVYGAEAAKGVPTIGG